LTFQVKDLVKVEDFEGTITYVHEDGQHYDVELKDGTVGKHHYKDILVPDNDFLMGIDWDQVSLWCLALYLFIIE
jgi:hypothetical protein